MDYNVILFEKIKREIHRGRLPLFSKLIDDEYNPSIHYSILFYENKNLLDEYEIDLLNQLIVEAMKKGKVIPQADIDMLVLDKYEK